MIKSFRHKGVQQFFETGSKAGIAAEHEAKLARQLTLLNAAKEPLEMDVAGWRLHQLKGELDKHWAVKVNGSGIRDNRSHLSRTGFANPSASFLTSYVNCIFA